MGFEGMGKSLPPSNPWQTLTLNCQNRKFKPIYPYDGLIPQNQFACQMLSKTYDDKIQDRMTHHPQHG